MMFGDLWLERLQDGDSDFFKQGYRIAGCFDCLVHSHSSGYGT